MAQAEDVARYILYLSQQEPEPELMSQMRLHKLVYYCQAWCLAMRDEPLFDERIEAWQHGPVVPVIYPVFADYSSNAIAAHESRDGENLRPDDRGLIDSIWANYRKYSASELRSMTHRERPWKDVAGGEEADIPPHTIISHDAMRSYYRRQYDKRARPGLDSNSLLNARKQFAERQGTDLREFVEGWR